ncbi:MAG TPA: HNH endonuclease [Syntrophorhabdaceae bacterium]|nr:HNH endonuclease [Syntrophorhabdaceae bacterium]
MDRTLLLNTTFEPLGIVSWKKAITLVYLGKVEVIEEYDREIKGINIKIRLPAVIRLLRFIRNGNTNIKFSRKNIFLRDNYTCQYCGKRFEPKDLTCDHIIPKSRGGITEWSNIVTSCIKCNLKKGDKLPEEINMQPKKRPSRPNSMYIFMLHLGIKTPPDLWKDYIFMRD